MTIVGAMTVMAGESAPEAIDAAYGADIPDALGRMVVKVIGSKNPDAITVDLSTEPPTLRLRGALCTVALGKTFEGMFLRNAQVRPQLHRVYSDYTGPGSEIYIQDYL